MLTEYDVMAWVADQLEITASEDHEFAEGVRISGCVNNGMMVRLNFDNGQEFVIHAGKVR